MPPPWFPFYPADWLSDPVLNDCTHEAKGVLIDMLALMWNDSGDCVWNDDGRKIARRLRIDIRVWRRIRKQLCEGEHSPLRTEHCRIFSPKLVRLWEKVRGTSAGLPPEVGQHLSESANEINGPGLQSPEAKSTDAERYVPDPSTPPVDNSEPEPDPMGNLAHRVRVLWTTHMVPAGFPPLTIDHSRRRAIERVARSGLLANEGQWTTLIGRCLKSSYLKGDVDGKRWASDFDWILDRAGQILDGRHDDRITHSVSPWPNCEFPGGCEKPANMGGLCFEHYEAKAGV